MDISVIRDILGDFSTIVRNVTKLFQGLPTFIADFADFFRPTTTEAGEASTAGKDAANVTSSIFKKN